MSEGLSTPLGGSINTGYTTQITQSASSTAWRASLRAGAGLTAPATRTDPEGLDPRFKPYADAILRVLRAYDSRFVMTSGRRSLAKQTSLYEAYKRGDNPYPVATPGCSSHQYGFAADFARPNVPPKSDPVLNYVGSLWQRYGGVWGGKADPIHFAIAVSLPRYCT